MVSSKEPVRLGGVGPGGGASDNARVPQAALGLPIKVVDGYRSRIIQDRACIYCEDGSRSGSIGAAANQRVMNAPAMNPLDKSRTARQENDVSVQAMLGKGSDFICDPRSR
jgi:hypothetical protein